MLRICAAVLTALALAFPPTSALGLNVQATVDATNMYVWDSPPAGEYLFVLRDRAGGVKAVTRRVAPGGTGFSVYFGETGVFAALSPGDQLQISRDGSPLPALTVPQFSLVTDPAADLTRGRLVRGAAGGPAPQVYVNIGGWRLTDEPVPGLRVPSAGVYVTPDAEGRFTTSWRGLQPRYDVQRNDSVAAWYYEVHPEITYEVRATGWAEGFQIYVGAPNGSLATAAGTTVPLRLLDGRGRLRATSFARAESYWAQAPFFWFRNRVPVPMRPGDRVVSASGAIACRIPPLEGTVDTAANRLSGRTAPGLVVQGLLYRVDGEGNLIYPLPELFAKADAASGVFAMDFAEDIVAGDQALLRIRNAAGDIFLRVVVAE